MVTTINSSNIKDQILELKDQRNAILLVHNYQIGEIQDIADYVGDSLGLAYQAKSTDADTIVFCGVHFMAETAKIINPNKTVILPDKDAGCSLEQSCDGHQLESFLKENEEKNYYVVAYINCSAHVKSLSDCICTSGNAVKIVESAPEDRPILFVPDQNLGSWVMEQTGRKMDLWQGSCYVHVEYTRESILKIREQFPNAELVSHPECTYAVRMLSDEVCSTEKMIGYAKQSNAKNIIIATENGMLHRLRKEVPEKNFIPAPTQNCACSECRYMKMNTLEKLRDCLQSMSPEVILSEDIRIRAERPIQKMLELSS